MGSPCLNLCARHVVAQEGWVVLCSGVTEGPGVIKVLWPLHGTLEKSGKNWALGDVGCMAGSPLCPPQWGSPVRGGPRVFTGWPWGPQGVQ